jgi:hypothetical protein
MPRRARMHGSGHRRLLKNEFFSNLVCSTSGILVITGRADRHNLGAPHR